MPHDPTRAVRQAARRAARAADAPLLLAVSGGLDSMVMLHAMASVARAHVAGVAAFDHASGPAATAAADSVARVAGTMGLPVVVGRMDPHAPATASREAAWRDARYRFLREAASSLGARVATAHTEDDQVETVLMRVMRGSGARGLAGLLASSDTVRPLLALRRASLETYASHVGVEWTEDPTNESPAFFRNRVRRDLLPALRRVDPAIDETLLAIGRDAAAWRRDVEAFVDAHVEPMRAGDRALVVGSSELAGYDRDSLAMLWAALAGRVGLALDRRGTERLAAFTMEERTTGSVPLSGGWRVEARPGSYRLEKARRQSTTNEARPLPRSGGGELRWGAFRFTVVAGDGVVGQAGPANGVWVAPLPANGGWTVRPWRPGDRLVGSGSQPPRRVKRYLSDAGVRGPDRSGWPVVVSGKDVIWIPGVRRSDAATARSGRPARHYVCERTHR
ncbi:MAG TPA: tRNA lysidine(34) synthetase TilS [Gemmatimonadaceae bacterium]